MRILSASADAAEWDAIVSKLPVQDVHFSSAYARVQEVAGGKAVLAVGQYGVVTVVQPFLMQPIEGTGLFDIKSLYGYGGPLSDEPVAAFIIGIGSAFREELITWARKTGVVSEYCCLHPLYAANQLPLVRDDNVQFTKQVVVIEDLATFDESRVSRRVRRGVRDARNRAIVLTVDNAVDFDRLYQASMDRLDAEDRWRFNLDYWEAHLDESVGGVFVVLTQDGIPRRELLVIGQGDTAYAHFLGSDGAFYGAGFDELLYFDTARWLSRQCGYKRFHLGGGITAHEKDSLLAFKSGFSQTKYTVGTYVRVFQPEVYDKLVKEQAAKERGQHGRESTAEWFPKYRRSWE